MKLKDIKDISSRYSFEAPVLNAEAKRTNHETVDSYLQVNITELLLEDKKDYFMVRVNGESMIDRNINDGDVLVVEKSNRPKNNDIVVAAVNGEMAVKTYKIINGKTYLFAENDQFLPLEISGFWNFEIQGIVRHAIKGV
ncbi:MAG: hypothetical protein Kapaf2KO_01100 [Candidatus Kapaibacteriales bacterium]